MEIVHDSVFLRFKLSLRKLFLPDEMWEYVDRFMGHYIITTTVSRKLSSELENQLIFFHSKDSQSSTNLVHQKAEITYPDPYFIARVPESTTMVVFYRHSSHFELWDIVERKRLARLHNDCKFTIMNVAFHEKTMLLNLMSPFRMEFWSTETWTRKSVNVYPYDVVRAVGYFNGESVILCGGFEKQWILFGFEKYVDERVVECKMPLKLITKSNFSPNGDMCVVCLLGTTLCILDTVTATILHQKPCKMDDLDYLQMSERYVLHGSNDIYLWDFKADVTRRFKMNIFCYAVALSDDFIAFYLQNEQPMLHTIRLM